MQLEEMNKEEFINYAKNFNVFKTVQWPEYLEEKERILNLLPKYNLTINDLYPDRTIIVPVRAYQGHL